jgi:hypothetical protein
MIAVTYVPRFGTILFRGMPGIWKGRHRLLLCGLVFMQALYPGRKPLAELARWTPGSITVWRLRRVLKAAYWNIHLLVEWWGQEAFTTLPPPKDGTLYLGGDGSVKPKRGRQHPMAQKGRKSEHQPWFWGVRFALVIATWDVYRLNVARKSSSVHKSIEKQRLPRRPDFRALQVARLSSPHLPVAYPRADLTSLRHSSPPRLRITGRLTPVYHTERLVQR